MVNKTLPTLAAGTTIGTSDLFLTRQGADTSDTKVTGTQLVTFMNSNISVNLATRVTGTLPVGNGGTGITSGTSGGLLYFSSASAIASSGALTANAVLKGGGAGAAPVASGVSIDSSNNVSGVGTLAAGATTITSASANSLVVGPNGATNPTLQVDSSPTSVAAGLQIAGSGSGQTSLQAISSASNVNISLASKGSGSVTVNANFGGVTFNNGGDVKFSHIGTDVFNYSNGYRLLLTPKADTTAANPRFSYTGAADVTLTASTEATAVYYNLGQTRQHATGALTTQRDFRITPTTHSFVASSTLTAASTLAIDGAPIGGTNATITTSNALLISAGALTNVTNGYGLNVSAPTGATNNYAAAFAGAVNMTTSTTTVSATPTIDAAAVGGQVITTWTPSTTTGGAGVFVTNLMRKTIVNTTSGSITTPAHPIAGYDYLEVTGGANTIDLMFVHESKYKKTGAATVNNISFYKPAIDSVAGTHSNIYLYDGDMDLSAVTYTNAYLMYCPRSYLTFQTSGRMVGATGNEIPTSVWPTVASGRFYLPRGWGSASTSAFTQGLVVVGPPVVISERTTFSAIGINVTAGVASSVARFGVYKMGANGVPTTQVYASGTISTASAGAAEATSINLTLEAGAYHLAYQSTGGSAPTISTIAFTDGFLIEVFGNNSANPGAATVEDVLYVAGTGALPSPFGTPTRLRVGAVPAVYLKK